MLKRILLTAALLTVAAYLVMAITAFNRKPADRTCGDIELLIKDTAYAGFITKKEVLSMLEKKGISPVGKNLDRVRTSTLEETLSAHPLIAAVECYKTPAGKVCVEVSQRIPVLRVMGSGAENYYVDNTGAVMPPDAKCVARLAVATGSVDRPFATTDLYRFAMFLQREPFWRAQIEQIHILPGRKVELVPRVGDHLIYLGRLDNYERKLERLKRFYVQGLNRVGWNKYSRISVEFGNQIICTEK